MSSKRYAKYHTKVFAKNRNSDYGTVVTVIAESRQAAINRAIELGWSGHDYDAQLIFTSIEDLHPLYGQQPDTPENPDDLTKP